MPIYPSQILSSATLLHATAWNEYPNSHKRNRYGLPLFQQNLALLNIPGSGDPVLSWAEANIDNAT